MAGIRRVSDLGTNGVANIVDGSVSTADIAANAVTQAKIDTTTPLSGMRNRVINGGMVVNQRGASSQTANLGFLVDRWRIYSGNSICGIYTSTDAPVGFRSSIYAQCNSAAGNSSYNGITHQIEGFNITDLGFGTASPSTLTISFWVKSSKTGVANFSLSNSNNSRGYVTEYTINTQNTWEYKTINIIADTNNTGWDFTTGMGLRLWWDLGSDPTTYNATVNTWVSADRIRTTGQTLNITSTLNSNLFITGVQVEKSTQPTPFEQRPYGLELALCQRYYFQNTSTLYLSMPLIAVGADNVNYTTYTWPVQMRRAPDVAVSGVAAEGHHTSSPSIHHTNTTMAGFEYNGATERSPGIRLNIGTLTANAEY